MAVTGAEPISAENLRAVIDGLGLGREMLFAGFCEEDSLNGSLCVPGSLSEYASFVIELFYSNTCSSVEVPSTAGNYTLVSGISVKVYTMTGCIAFNFSSSKSSLRICRIFGVRAAG